MSVYSRFGSCGAFRSKSQPARLSLAGVVMAACVVGVMAEGPAKGSGAGTAGLDMVEGRLELNSVSLPKDDAGSPSATPRFGGPLIYDNGPADGSTGYGIRGSSTFDDFALTSAETVASIRFHYLQASPFDGTGSIRIFSDAGGSVGSLVHSSLLTNVNFQPTGGNVAGFAVFSVEADLAVPVGLAAGTYWLSPDTETSVCAGGGQFWQTTTQATGAIGTQTPFTCTATSGNLNLGVNFSFQLFGPAGCTTEGLDEFRTASIGAEDGYVREPNLITMAEGPAVAKGTVAQVGDDNANWQNRGVFSFDTSGIPDDAEITTATLRLTRASSAGNVAPLGNLVLDMGGSLIGATAALDTFDYDDASAASLDVATSFPLPGGNGFTTFAAIDPAFFANFDLEGKTQFRVRFENLTDNDNQSDYLAFHTGEAAANVRPELIVEYATGECVTFPETDPCDGPFEVTLWSLPAQDGGVGESHYTSEVGGSIGAGSGTSAVGDTGSRTQQKLLLHFDTSAIPTDATITSAALRLYRSSATGAAAASLGPLVVDMRNPYAGAANFGTSDALEAEDFQSYAQFQGVATLTVPVSNTYTEAFLDATGLQAINKGGATQMRVRFTLPDDGDFLADQVNFGTGNFGATSPGRPRLVVTYMTPCP